MIKIIDYYQKQKSDGKLKFEYNKKHPGKPIWIKVLNRPKGVRFLGIQTDKHPEIIYRSFGKYFYPIDQTPEEGKMFIDAIAKDYDAMVGKNNLLLAEQLFGKLKKLNLPKNIAVVDLGAGTGIASSVLSKQGYKNLTLFDYSKEMLAMAKSKIELSGAKFIVGDATQDLPDEKYNLIISVMLFDYFDDKKLEKTLGKWAERLKDGGIFAIIEDANRPAYKNFFDMIEEGTIKVGEMEKYYFIGRKREKE